MRRPASCPSTDIRLACRASGGTRPRQRVCRHGARAESPSSSDHDRDLPDLHAHIYDRSEQFYVECEPVDPQVAGGGPRHIPGEKLEATLGVREARDDPIRHRPEHHATDGTVRGLPLGKCRATDASRADDGLEFIKQRHDNGERFDGVARSASI